MVPGNKCKLNNIDNDNNNNNNNIIIIEKCGIYWQIVIGALGAIPGGLSEYLENDWGWYVSEDVSEDCSFGISNDLEKVHGTVKISTALDSLRPLVFGWTPNKQP